MLKNMNELNEALLVKGYKTNYSVATHITKSGTYTDASLDIDHKIFISKFKWEDIPTDEKVLLNDTTIEKSMRVTLDEALAYLLWNVVQG